MKCYKIQSLYLLFTISVFPLAKRQRKSIRCANVKIIPVIVADLSHYTGTITVLCTKYVLTHPIKMARRTTHSLIADTYHSANTTIIVVMATNTSRITYNNQAI